MKDEFRWSARSQLIGTYADVGSHSKKTLLTYVSRTKLAPPEGPHRSCHPHRLGRHRRAGTVRHGCDADRQADRIARGTRGRLCRRVVGGAVLMGRRRLYVAGSRSVVGEYRLGCEVGRSNSGSRVSRITSHLERWRGCRCFNICSETTVKPKKLRGSTTVSGAPPPNCT